MLLTNPQKNNPEFHKRAKHINLLYHYIRETVEKGFIEINYARSHNQLADILTKSLPKEQSSPTKICRLHVWLES